MIERYVDRIESQMLDTQVNSRSRQSVEILLGHHYFPIILEWNHPPVLGILWVTGTPRE